MDTSSEGMLSKSASKETQEVPLKVLENLEKSKACLSVLREAAANSHIRISDIIALKDIGQSAAYSAIEDLQTMGLVRIAESGNKGEIRYEATDLGLETGRIIGRVTEDLKRLERKVGVQSHMITSKGYLQILLLALFRGEITHSKLVEQIGLNRTTASRSLRRLKLRGLLDFKRDGQFPRICGVYSLTETGRVFATGLLELSQRVARDVRKGSE